MVENQSNYAHVIERVARTETAVASLESDMQVVMSGVSDIRNMLVEQNKPEPTNVIGWLGVGFSVMVMIAALLFGITEYVYMQVEPLREENQEIKSELSDLRKWKNKTHYEFGVIHERLGIVPSSDG